jgi:hypothetical protein
MSQPTRGIADASRRPSDEAAQGANPAGSRNPSPFMIERANGAGELGWRIRWDDVVLVSLCAVGFATAAATVVFFFADRTF